MTRRLRRIGKALSAMGCVALSSLALAGCQSPLYSGTPDDLNAPLTDRSYVGRGTDADDPPSPPADAPRYEYRGGRDPATGRAKTQM
jgi:hypothetical protein